MPRYSKFFLLALFVLISMGIIYFFKSKPSDGFIQTGSGLKYKLVRDSNGPTFVKDHYVVFHMEYFDEQGTVIYSSLVRDMPVTLPFNDSIWNHTGQIYEGLAKMTLGDSAVFKVFCADLYQKSFRSPIPAGLDPKSIITFYVGADKMLSPEEFREFQSKMVAKRETERKIRQEKQFLEDISVIDGYLEENKLIPQETSSGIRYIIKKLGSGKSPQNGDQVTVHYTGYLLDGTVFDSTYEKEEPDKWVMGRGMVIKGLEEALMLIPSGSEFVFYIPSGLAYGERGSGSLIRPNSILVFEIELLKIN